MRQGAEFCQQVAQVAGDSFEALSSRLEAVQPSLLAHGAASSGSRHALGKHSPDIAFGPLFSVSRFDTLLRC